MEALFAFIFLAIPILVISFFVTSLCRFIHAKRVNKKTPDTFSNGELTGRLISLIISSVIMAVLVLIVVGLITLSYMIVAYM